MATKVEPSTPSAVIDRVSLVLDAFDGPGRLTLAQIVRRTGLPRSSAHRMLERLVHQPRVHLFLDGLTAGVVGLIAGTTLALLKVSLTGLAPFVLFALALAALFASKAKLAVPAVIGAAALWGLLSQAIGVQA